MNKEKIEFSVKMTAKEVYRFMMYHVYHGLSGIFGVCVSLIALIFLFVSFDSMPDQTRAILILVAAWFVIIDPIILFFRSRGQVKRNKSYQKPLQYRLDESGVTVSQDELEQTVPWENLMKIIETKTQYLVYSSKVHAFVFPKEAVGENSDALEWMVLYYADGADIRLKRPSKKQKNSEEEV